MDTIFMNSKNSKTSEKHRFVLDLRDKINLKLPQKHIALSNLSIYYTWKNVKKAYNNNKFKIIAPSWTEEFELPDGSYTVADINNYFQYIVTKNVKDHEKEIEIYVNKITNRITFKIKSGWSLELMTPETQALLGSTEAKITKTKNGELVPEMEITEVVLVHCNLVNNDYQHDSRVLYTFVPDKGFGQLLSVSPSEFIWLKTFQSEFSTIEVWFTDQESRPLEIEGRVNLTMVIR